MGYNYGYDINVLIDLRKNDRPSQDNKPIEEDYWVKLIIKGEKEPEKMTAEKNPNIAVNQVLPYTRRLNGIFEKK